MKKAGNCFLCMALSEAAMILGFAMGASLEEILTGMLALLAACLLYLRITAGRGGRE